MLAINETLVRSEKTAGPEILRKNLSGQLDSIGVHLVGLEHPEKLAKLSNTHPMDGGLNLETLCKGIDFGRRFLFESCNGRNIASTIRIRNGLSNHSGEPFDIKCDRLLGALIGGKRLRVISHEDVKETRYALTNHLMRFPDVLVVMTSDICIRHL